MCYLFIIIVSSVGHDITLFVLKVPINPNQPTSSVESIQK